MSDSKEYMRSLLDTAFSSPTGEVVNFRALRTLLEVSIDQCGEKSSGSDTKASNDQAKASRSDQKTTDASAKEKKQKKQKNAVQTENIALVMEQNDDTGVILRINLPDGGVCADEPPTISLQPTKRQSSNISSKSLKRVKTTKDDTKLKEAKVTKSFETMTKPKDIAQKSGPIKKRHMSQESTKQPQPQQPKLQRVSSKQNASTNEPERKSKSTAKDEPKSKQQSETKRSTPTEMTKEVLIQNIEIESEDQVQKINNRKNDFSVKSAEVKALAGEVLTKLGDRRKRFSELSKIDADNEKRTGSIKHDKKDSQRSGDLNPTTTTSESKHHIRDDHREIGIEKSNDQMKSTQQVDGETSEEAKIQSLSPREQIAETRSDGELATGEIDKKQGQRERGTSSDRKMKPNQKILITITPPANGIGKDGRLKTDEVAQKKKDKSKESGRLKTDKVDQMKKDKSKESGRSKTDKVDQMKKDKSNENDENGSAEAKIDTQRDSKGEGEQTENDGIKQTIDGSEYDATSGDGIGETEKDGSGYHTPVGCPPRIENLSIEERDRAKSQSVSKIDTIHKGKDQDSAARNGRLSRKSDKMDRKRLLSSSGDGKTRGKVSGTRSNKANSKSSSSYGLSSARSSMIGAHKKKTYSSSGGGKSGRLSGRTTKTGTSSDRFSSSRVNVTRNDGKKYGFSTERHSKSTTSGLSKRDNQLTSHTKANKKRDAIGKFRTDYKVSHDKKRINAEKRFHSTQSMPSTKKIEVIQTQKFKRAKNIMEKLKKYKKSNLLMNDIQEIMRMGPFAAQILTQVCVNCNALSNSKRCICNEEMCISDKPIKKPTICFCADSYVRGKDGFVYHSKCNCCGDH